MGCGETGKEGEEIEVRIAIRVDKDERALVMIILTCDRDWTASPIRKAEGWGR